MQPRVQFVHLRLPDTWPTTVDEFWRIVDQHHAPGTLSTLYPPGTTLGLLSREGIVEALLANRDIVVQVALLSLPFFHDCGTDEIADVRSKPHRHLPCPHLPALVETLAICLVVYENVRVDIAKEGVHQPSRGRASLLYLETLARWYSNLHERRRIKFPLVTPTQLKSASGTYTLLLESLEGGTYEKWATHMDRTLHDSLIARMREAFKRHGPTDQPYSQLCIDHMVAVVLKNFGLETSGTESQIAERFRKRLQRRKE